MESRQEKKWTEIQWKGPLRHKQTQEQNKKEWASSVGLCQTHKPRATSPPHEGELAKRNDII